ncbi:MAG: hypothetical protein ACM3JG_12195 [Thiohalocapsa sp.]
MASLNRARLRRRLAVLTTLARRRVAARETAREYAAAWASLDAAFKAARIDPAGIGCLNLLGDVEGRLRRLGEGPQALQADTAFRAADDRQPRDEPFHQRAARRAADFIGRPPPDRGASLLDWYAWSLAVAGKCPSSTTADLPPNPAFPAKAGTHGSTIGAAGWVPASAGMRRVDNSGPAQDATGIAAAGGP